MSELEEIISDELIDQIWGNSNFGTTPRREVIRNTLLKCASGYYTGSTAKAIVTQLGLVNPTKWTLTKLGKTYLFAAYSQGLSV